MKEIIIATETGSDLPQTLVDLYQIKIIPMHVIMDSVDYPDGSIPVDQVYDYHNRTKKIPTTSATNINEYIDFYTALQKEHPDAVIYHMAYTSKASCTFQNAKIALKNFDNIYLIDTLNVSGGCTAHIAKAYSIIQEHLAKDAEPDYQAIADEIQSWAHRIRCSFIPGNLDYLKAGGRVSNAAYLGATILQLKPLIELIDGKLIAAKKYRGKMENIVDKYMTDFIGKHNLDKNCLYLLYSKGVSQKVLDRMAENAKRFGFQSYQYVQTGCVISTHSGPGAIGLSGVEKA